MTVCSNCSSKINRNWNFCPKCGNRIIKGFNLNDMINKQMDHFKKILDISNYDISIHPQSENTFVVNISHGLGKNSSVMGEHDHLPYKQKKVVNQMKLPRNVSEPDATVKGGKNKFFVEVKLPGVKDEKNIEIVRMKNSMEIRAKDDKIGYFKILKIPSRHRLIGKKLVKEKLILKFST